MRSNKVKVKEEKGKLDVKLLYYLFNLSKRMIGLPSLNEEYEEIPVVLKLKKNVAEVGKLIAKYQYRILWMLLQVKRLDKQF